MAGVEKERITVVVVLEEDACQAPPRAIGNYRQSGLTGAGRNSPCVTVPNPRELCQIKTDPHFTTKCQ